MEAVKIDNLAASIKFLITNKRLYLLNHRHYITICCLSICEKLLHFILYVACECKYGNNNG